MIYVNFSPEGYFINVSTEASVVNGFEPIPMDISFDEFNEKLGQGTYRLRNGLIKFEVKPSDTHIFSNEENDWVIDKATIKRARQHALLHFPYNGCEFQVDSSSLTLIAGRALKITRQQLNNGPVENQVWRTTDNLFVTFTPNEFLDFAEAADNYVEQIYSQSWQQIDGDN